MCLRPCRNTENPSPQIFRKKKRKLDASALCVCLKFVTPPEKASVCLQMILFQNPCQQFSSLFPACGFSYLDHLSRGTQATLCRPAPSAQRALSQATWTLQHVLTTDKVCANWRRQMGRSEAQPAGVGRQRNEPNTFSKA